MVIASTRRQPVVPSPPTPPALGQVSLLSGIPLDERTLEIPEVALGLSGLQESAPILGHSVRLGLGGLALMRTFQALEEGGLEGRLEAFSTAGLAVAAGASVFSNGTAELIGRVAESAHGLAEVSLGCIEIASGLKERNSPELTSGLLGIAKGVSTFLPMVAPGLADAVAYTHLGLLFSRALLAPHIEAARLSQNPQAELTAL